ncbi:hypothetical protein ACHAQA_001570 [Verticillium albo-atrum]
MRVNGNRKTKGQTPRSENGISPELAAVLPYGDTPWYHVPHLARLILLSITLSLLSAAIGYDGSMMNGLMALPQWYEFMEHPSGSWLGFINAIGPLSSTLGYPVVAYFANRWGRKKGIWIGYFFLLLGALLQTFTPNYIGFVLSRLFVGQASAWWAGLAPLLITESAFPTHRAFLTALYSSGCNDWSWRIPSILQAAIPILVIPAALLFPESPRFLISKGRNDEARRILVKHHAGGDENSLLVDFEMTEIHRALEFDEATSKSWMELIATKGNRHRAFITCTLGLFAQWNGVGVVSYYLALVLQTAGITSVTHQTLISGFMQIWNLGWAVGAAAMVDRIGRRGLFLISSTGMLVTYVVITALSGSFDASGNASVGIAVVPCLFIFYGFYDIAFTPLTIAYPAEIWPYELRARGTALVQLTTNLALFFNVFVNPIALENIGWRYYIVFAVILVIVTLTIYFFYPETKGHTLEEMAVIFDGEAAAVTEVPLDADKVGSQQVEKV